MHLVMVKQSIFQARLEKKLLQSVDSCVHVSINAQNDFGPSMVLTHDKLRWVHQELSDWIHVFFSEEMLMLVANSVTCPRVMTQDTG